jgi:hypothetical protein
VGEVGARVGGRAPGDGDGRTRRPRGLRNLRGTGWLFAFAVVGLASAAVATRVAAGASGSARLRVEVTLDAGHAPATALLVLTPREGVDVHEIRIRQGSEVVGRLLQPPYVYVAAELAGGHHGYVVEIDDDGGTTRQRVSVDVPT